MYFHPFVDNEEPIFMSCPANQTKETASGLSTALVVWTELQATDNSGELTNITCNVKSGGQFEIGETEVVCKARDPSGNGAVCSFNIEIKGNKVIRSTPISLWRKIGHNKRQFGLG